MVRGVIANPSAGGPAVISWSRLEWHGSVLEAAARPNVGHEPDDGDGGRGSVNDSAQRA